METNNNTQTVHINANIKPIIDRSINVKKDRIAHCMTIEDRFEAYAQVGLIMIDVIQCKLYTKEQKEELLTLIKEVYKRED